MEYVFELQARASMLSTIQKSSSGSHTRWRSWVVMVSGVLSSVFLIVFFNLKNADSNLFDVCKAYYKLL